MQQLNLSFHNNYTLLQKIDSLPTGPDWICKQIKVEGDLKDGDGKLRQAKVELWYRDPVECIKEIIGNPAFKEFLAYAPERVFSDEKGQDRIYDEMWTSDWWWETQVSK
jgi:hypothetical protein